MEHWSVIIQRGTDRGISLWSFLNIVPVIGFYWLFPSCCRKALWAPRLYLRTMIIWGCSGWHPLKYGYLNPSLNNNSSKFKVRLQNVTKYLWTLVHLMDETIHKYLFLKRISRLMTTKYDNSCYSERQTGRYLKKAELQNTDWDLIKQSIIVFTYFKAIYYHTNFGK